MRVIEDICRSTSLWIVVLTFLAEGSLLPRTDSLGSWMPSAYLGERNRCRGIMEDPFHGSCGLLQLPSAVLYFFELVGHRLLPTVGQRSSTAEGPPWERRKAFSGYLEERDRSLKFPVRTGIFGLLTPVVNTFTRRRTDLRGLSRSRPTPRLYRRTEKSPLPRTTPPSRDGPFEEEKRHT